ncbi:MAG: hypothetical protein R6W86_12945 [Marinobacter sp.]|uniref:hypothetical protein n=1 Tax=Marinobacter sp. TaxID=50741 RepID=UPI00396D9475
MKSHGVGYICHVLLNHYLSSIVALSFLAALMLMQSGCAMTMTNTFDVIGERTQEGEVIHLSGSESARIPVTEFEYRMDDNFFYALEWKSHISRQEFKHVGDAILPVQKLTPEWQPVTASINDKSVEVEARMYKTEAGYHLVQIRRDYQLWYAYPADAVAYTLMPIDLVKNSVITGTLIHLYGFLNLVTP